MRLCEYWYFEVASLSINSQDSAWQIYRVSNFFLTVQCDKLLLTCCILQPQVRPVTQELLTRSNEENTIEDFRKLQFPQPTGISSPNDVALQLHFRSSLTCSHCYTCSPSLSCASFSVNESSHLKHTSIAASYRNSNSNSENKLNFWWSWLC